MKAVSLLSGGLDSQLAVRVIQEQGIEVVGLNFTSPFFGGGDELKKVGQRLGIEVLFPEVGDAYLELLRNPAHGFGRNCNPCIDCHAFMMRRAGEMMANLGASFIITGEVLGQRPMSQNRNALKAVEKTAGLEGYILRPLCAKLLEETIPEQKGWVDREKLLNFHGRGRNPQMELAAKLGVTDYPTPAGGCLLTQEATARRIKRYFSFRPELNALDELMVLKVGRHFYLDDNTLLVVGRNQSDNRILAGIGRPGDRYIRIDHHPGPLALLRTSEAAPAALLEQGARITARYGDGKNEPQVEARILNLSQEETARITVTPYKPEEIPQFIA